MKFVYLIFVFAFVFGNTLAQKNVDDSSGESSESMSADDNAKADNGQANFIDHMVLNRARNILSIEDISVKPAGDALFKFVRRINSAACLDLLPLYQTVYVEKFDSLV